MTADAPLQQRFGLTVTPQNVLGVRAVVLQEAHDLEKMLHAERERATLPLLGSDPVSNDMSQGFNLATEQLLNRARRHVDSLFELTEELAATASAYGRTESEIKSSFSTDSPRTAASRIGPTLREAAGFSATAARPQPQSVSDLLTGGRS